MRESGYTLSLVLGGSELLKLCEELSDTEAAFWKEHATHCNSICEQDCARCHPLRPPTILLSCASRRRLLLLSPPCCCRLRSRIQFVPALNAV